MNQPPNLRLQLFTELERGDYARYQKLISCASFSRLALAAKSEGKRKARSFVFIKSKKMRFLFFEK
jgi:hypothetical protein